MRYSIVIATIVAVATSAPISMPAVGPVEVPSITVSPIVVSGITTPKADVNVGRRGVTDTTLKTEFSAIEAELPKIEAIPVKRQTNSEVSSVVTTVEGEAKPSDPSSTLTKVDTLVQSSVPSVPGVGVPKLPVRR